MDITKAIELLNKASKLTQIPEISDLKSIIYSLQSENLDLKENIAALKKQIDENAQWEKDRKNLKLANIENSSIVLVDPKSHVFYCPACVRNRHIVPLQNALHHKLVCPACDVKFNGSIRSNFDLV